ncbi:MAG: DUF58 domain-containing protein [Lachnospiraceae bacterium]|nr:DUF58 domain-containing protein [Lachnospiraceae bacterium]MDE6698139.1 DUF58 domain-containing protein [Lachnospiraceae bacterium]
MRMKYVSRIQSNLKKYKTIHTGRVTSRILDGSYNSVYKGRSMNFDELREYVAGDDIKDMDWKASARSQKMLVRQYVAEKKHNIMLVMDTNRRMLADTTRLKEKRDVALMSAGTLAYLVNRNGDYISSTYVAGELVKHFPFKMGLMNVENILENYYKAVTMENQSKLSTSLEYIIRNFKRRMIIIVVTDMEGMRNVSENTLKRLLVMHDVLMINISDADTSGKNVYNVEGGNYLSEYFTEDKVLAKLEAEKRQAVKTECEDKLKKFGIASSTIDDTDDIDMRIVELLEKHKIEKR